MDSHFKVLGKEPKWRTSGPRTSELWLTSSRFRLSFFPILAKHPWEALMHNLVLSHQSLNTARAAGLPCHAIFFLHPKLTHPKWSGSVWARVAIKKRLSLTILPPTARPSFEVEMLAVCTLTYTQLPPIQPAVWEADTVAHPLIWERLKTWVGGWLVEKI